MPMSLYYVNLRKSIGTQRIFNPSVLGIIRNESGDILFVRAVGSREWGLPAGSIELGETPAQAVVREVGEETGLNVLPTGILGVFGGDGFRWVYPDGNEVEYLVVAFACEVVTGAFHPQDGEIAECRYFPPNDLPPLLLPYPQELFHEDGQGKAIFQWE